MQMTQQEIDQVKKEIEDFKAKSIQHATSSPSMSAHYHRLFMTSKGSLKRFDRMARTLENKAYEEERKRLKKGAVQATAAASSTKGS